MSGEEQETWEGSGKLRIKLATASTVFKVIVGIITHPTILNRRWPRSESPVEGAERDRDRGVSRHNRDNYGVPLPRVVNR